MHRFLAPCTALLSGTLVGQTFVDVTATSGLQNLATSHVIDGSGLCCADFDGDGDLDLVIPGPIGAPIHYFRNDGGMTFTDLTTQTGLANAIDPRSAVAADIDNDGDQDFLISNIWAPLQLFVNDGSANFTEEAQARGLVTQGSAYSLALGDFDRDGWLDLYVGNREGVGQLSHPNVLYRGTGNGYFTDVSVASSTDHLGLTYAAPFFDYDEDGFPDLIIANDKGNQGYPSTVLRNLGDGTFADIGAAINASWPIDGMGVDFVDVFNDGGFDAYLTDSPVDHLFLHWNSVSNQYENQTYAYGLAGGGLGWAANYFDFDNDGWQDLHVVQTGTPNLLYRNPGAPAAQQVAWTDEAFAHGLAAFARQYAAIVADLDNDGRVDLVNRYELHPLLPNQPGATVHHNLVGGGNWLKFVTRGTVSNRDGIGARIELQAGGQTQRQYVRNGVGFLSGSDPRTHFGLGSATQADRVTIYWPSGQVQYLDAVPANQILEVVEPSLTLAGPVPAGGSSTLHLHIQGDEGLLYGMVLAFRDMPRSQLPDGRYLPLALDGLSSYTFIPGNIFLSNPLNYLDAFGRASSQLSMPNQPALVGLPLYATAATVPPQGLPAIRTIFPAALRFTIQ